MKKINFIIFFIFIITTLSSYEVEKNSYEVEKDEVVKVKTLFIEFKSGIIIHSNFNIKEKEKRKSMFEFLDMGIEDFIKKIGYKNVLNLNNIKIQILKSSFTTFFVTIIYK